MTLARDLPRFAVVVPSLNQGSYLAEALQSLISQDYPAVDIVVMDGGSSDGSGDIIEAFSGRLFHWQSLSDGGQAAAINEGLTIARGDLVGWLNADDQLAPDALWRVARAFTRHRDHGLFIGNGLRQLDPGGARRPFCRRHVALNRRALAHGIDYVLQPATFFSRAAWDEAGGLHADLKYGMDWDLVQRIAARHSAVLINDCLAISREHESTKTARGGWERVSELLKLAETHAGESATPGGLHYAFETLLRSMDSPRWDDARGPARASFAAVHQALEGVAGNADGFPEQSDPQDVVDVPTVEPSWPWPRVAEGARLPKISVVMPSFNQSAFLPRAIDSILGQNYPSAEIVVFDGGSTDGSADILGTYGSRLSHCAVEKDRGPAHAINKGLALAQGEVLGWLCSDDMLAHGALIEIGKAFAEDPELDLVYGNALYVDAFDRMTLANHGTARTGLYFGEMQAPERVPRYWEYVHALPQPTVFFRRRLLEACGPLNEGYQFIFDFELFARMGAHGKVRKIEKTLAFYRLHEAGKSADWKRFLIELYRYSRPRWPRILSSDFVDTWASFVRHFVRRRHGRSARDFRSWPLSAMAGASSLTRIGNPERW